jgi:hypothetical protein
MLSQTKRRNRMPGRQSLGTAGGVAPAGFLIRLDHMQIVPNHREREFMQRLRGRGWVRASQIPDAAITLKDLIKSDGSNVKATARMHLTGSLTKVLERRRR